MLTVTVESWTVETSCWFYCGIRQTIWTVFPQEDAVEMKERIMPNDQKVGFALGLLLLGIVAAFFFRNPQMKSPAVPELESSEEVDARISEKAVTPYLTGIDADKEETAGHSRAGEKSASYGADFPSRREAPHWEVPEFLKMNTAETSENRYSNPETVTPNPIPLVSETRNDTKLTSTNNSKTLKYIPDHNQGWETVPPIPIPDVAGESPLQDRNSANGLRQEGPSDSADVLLHTVKSGETLSSIAADHLGSSARFEDIYEANRDLLKNPNDLRVGMKLKIPTQKRGVRDREGLALPADGPSASNANSAETTKPATATSRKGLTRAAVRTPEGNPLKSDDADEQSTADDPATESTRTTRPAGSVAPKGRFAPMRRSPYRPRTSLDQSSLDLDNLLDPGAGTTSKGKKILTQIPPDDLPLDVEIEDDAATAQQDGEFAIPSGKVK